MCIQIVSILFSDLLMTDLKMTLKINKPDFSTFGKVTDLNDRMLPTYGNVMCYYLMERE